MGRISKGYAISALIFGISEIICGIVITICSIVLTNKITSSFSVNGNSQLAAFTGMSYWWGGSPFIIPGILGIVTYCTRNPCGAICHLIFNIICFLAACVCAGIAALLLTIWSAVVALYDAGNCVSTSSQCICDVGDYTVQLGSTCSIVTSLNSLFMAMAVSASIGALIILICCYVNCVSLCNQEQEQMSGFVLNPTGGMVNQTQPAVVFSGNTNQQMQAPPPY